MGTTRSIPSRRRAGAPTARNLMPATTMCSPDILRGRLPGYPDTTGSTTLTTVPWVNSRALEPAQQRTEQP